MNASRINVNLAREPNTSELRPRTLRSNNAVPKVAGRYDCWKSSKYGATSELCTALQCIGSVKSKRGKTAASIGLSEVHDRCTTTMLLKASYSMDLCVVQILRSDRIFSRGPEVR